VQKKITPFSPRSTSPRLRTGESMHLVCFWPSPTSRVRRERQQGASGVRWWVGTARFCVQEGCFFRAKNHPIFASFDTAPSPHRRVNAPSLLLAFAHIQGEAGTPTGGVGSAVVDRNSPVLCAGGCFFHAKKMTPFSPRLTHGHSLKKWILFAFWDFLFFVMTLWVFALMVEELYMLVMHERCIEVRCVEERLHIVYFIIMYYTASSNSNR
jgi:hypothetical protein